MGGVIDTVFGGGQGAAYNKMRGAANDAMETTRQYGSQQQAALNPFTSQSSNWINNYQQDLNKSRDPTAYFNELMGGYKQSPYAKQLTQQGQQALGAAAASSGMLGSGAYGQHSAEMAEDISSKDMQQYLNNVLGIHNNYMQGSQHLMNTGYDATQRLVDMLRSTGQDISSLFGQKGQAEAGQAQAHAQAMRGLGSTALMALGGGLGMIPGMAGGLPGAFGGATGMYQMPKMGGR